MLQNEHVRLKIGLVCPYNITKGGGVQEGILAIRHELAARGHDAKIITPLPRDVNAHDWPDVIFIGTATDVKSPFATTAQISVSLKNDEIERVLAHEHFDVLHFHEPWVPMMSRQLLGKSEGINVATFHARLPDTLMSKTIEAVVTPYTKPLVKRLDGLTAVSNAAAEYVQGLTKKPIHIIPNGIDLKKYKAVNQNQINKPESTKTILFIGRLEKRKGVKYLLKALGLVQKQIPEVRLIIAGEGPDRERLELLTAQLNLKNVEFKGFVDEATKMELLRQADVFCSPALYGESFGIVLLEAMAMNLPIVAGDNPGYKAVLQERGKLSLVSPKNTEAFARRLEVFLEDAELQAIWRNWASMYVKAFDYPKVVDKYEELYRELLKAR
ncbi:glycosyltransferase family 4 protein [Candidatus Saccharibacteria bacterium]|nr:glycosyltransferase family 4 protein [Candidatus Saccharibacteria bacterium]